MLKIIFKDKLKIAMENSKISQAKLSKLSGISKSSISQYLAGAYSPKFDNICIIAEILNADPFWLASSDNEDLSFIESSEDYLVKGQINRDYIESSLLNLLTSPNFQMYSGIRILNPDKKLIKDLVDKIIKLDEK